VWNGQLYFGTRDGRVALASGYADNVQLANPANLTPIAWSLLTAFQSGGNMRKKQCSTIKVDILSAIANPTLTMVAKYDYDTNEPVDTSSSGSGGPNSWDIALWDKAVWTNDYTPNVVIGGATGMGRSIALAIRGQAISRTIYLNASAIFEQGGDL
jgi:hypothetical protein